MHSLQHRLPYQYSHIYSTRGLRSIQCWNQRLKYYSSTIFNWRQNQMTFTFFSRDLSTYTLRCIRCGQSVTLPGSIGESLLHAPTAMLYHWNMIQSHAKQNHRELMLMPLFFTSYDNYLQSSKSFQEGLNWIRDLKICQKPTEYG
jgi:hypothetical protein